MVSLRLPALVLWIVAACATAGKTDPSQQNDAPANDDAQLTIDGNNCVNQPCDILTQCGCAANAACDIDGSDLDGGACRTVSGAAVGEGGGCAGPVNCQGGNVCLGNNPGVCHKFCDANNDCGQPRGQCLIQITDGTNPIPNIPKACSSNCDPTNVGAGGCPANAKCGLFNTGAPQNLNFVDCDTAGSLVQGGNCGPAPGNDALCAPNFICTTIDNNVSFQCRKVCTRPNTGCVGAQTCLALGAAPGFVVGGVEYGACN